MPPQQRTVHAATGNEHTSAGEHGSSLSYILRDPARLVAVRRTVALDLAAEAAFDRLSRLASSFLHAPVALVSLVEGDRQVFKGCIGLPEPWASTRETPLSHSFCQHVVATAAPLLIEDARVHPLVLDNLAIRDLNAVAYAGIPLRTSDGHILGSFCVIDDHPRTWKPEEIAVLGDLATSVMTEIELWAALREMQRHAMETNAEHLRTHEALTALLQMAEILVAPIAGGVQTVPEAVPPVARRLAELTCRVLDCQDATIVTLAPETLALESIASVGYPPEQERAMWDRLRGTRLSDRLGDPILIKRLRAGGVLLVDAMQPPHTAPPGLPGTHLALCAPLRIEGQLVGILTLTHAEPLKQFTGDDMALVAAVAKLAALVLERERLLHERAEGHAREIALSAANNRMSEFLTLVSHELRTPLTSIRGYVQLATRRVQRHATQTNGQTVAESSDAASIEDTLVPAEQQIRRLDRLIGELLDTSRIQAGMLSLRLQPYDLVTLVASVVDEHRRHNPQVDVTLDLPARGTALVRVDPDRLAQALLNYISNAQKYGPPGCPIAVRLDCTDTDARVSVCDEGPGIAPYDQDRVWERFYRIEDEDERVTGLGLGLYISRTLIEQHGGRVGVESAPGKGARFWFTLPLLRDGGP